jgi:hypothetical protein
MIVWRATGAMGNDAVDTGRSATLTMNGVKETCLTR